MTGKGLFTQCFIVLLKDRVSLDDVERQLSGFDLLGRYDGAGSWEFGGPAEVVAYRPEVHGMVAVDVVDHVWDDGLGDPEREATESSPWGSGALGPAAYPGCLGRALEFCEQWDEARDTVGRHQAYLRIRSSFSLGLGDDAWLWPEDYSPFQELLFVSRVAECLLQMPQALCYFNPSGEVLQTYRDFAQAMEIYAESDQAPYFLWTNSRSYPLDNCPEWHFVDLIGNEQLDLPDLEALFFGGEYDDQEVAQFLYELTHYLVEEGEIVEEGEAFQGQDDTDWLAQHYAEGGGLPPRRVIRFIPLDGHEPPELTGKKYEDDDEDPSEFFEEEDVDLDLDSGDDITDEEDDELDEDFDLEDEEFEDELDDAEEPVEALAEELELGEDDDYEKGRFRQP